MTERLTHLLLVSPEDPAESLQARPLSFVWVSSAFGFYVLVIVNSAAMNTGVLISPEVLISILLDKYSVVDINGYYGSLVLIV